MTERRLVRRTNDKMIAGVASGVADFFGIDPTLVRVGFVLLTIFGGSGAVLYLIMWVIVPTADSAPQLPQPPGEQTGWGTPRRPDDPAGGV
jgi:phage shock protein C